MYTYTKMVETRSQKRKLEEVDSSDLEINESNINCNIKKKKKHVSSQKEIIDDNADTEDTEDVENSEPESEAIMTNENSDTTSVTNISELLCSEDDEERDENDEDDDEEDDDFIDDDNVEEDTKLERKILNMKFDPKQTQEIIKDSIKTLIKRYAREGKEFLKTNSESEYEQFNDLIDSIYGGEFFERVPLEDRKKKLKDTLSKDEVKELNEQLQKIKSQYNNNSPSIIDILRMNVSIEQKQKLLEKVHCLVNSEVLIPEYNSNRKFLT